MNSLQKFCAAAWLRSGCSPCSARFRHLQPTPSWKSRRRRPRRWKSRRSTPGPVPMPVSRSATAFPATTTPGRPATSIPTASCGGALRRLQLQIGNCSSTAPKAISAIPGQKAPTASPRPSRASKARCAPVMGYRGHRRRPALRARPAAQPSDLEGQRSGRRRQQHHARLDGRRRRRREADRTGLRSRRVSLHRLRLRRLSTPAAAPQSVDSKENRVTFGLGMKF